jgi:hypothetical protein
MLNYLSLFFPWLIFRSLDFLEILIPGSIHRICLALTFRSIASGYYHPDPQFTGYLGSILCTAVSTDSALDPSKKCFAQAVSYYVLVQSSLYLPIKEVDNPK